MFEKITFRFENYEKICENVFLQIKIHVIMNKKKYKTGGNKDESIICLFSGDVKFYSS